MRDERREEPRTWKHLLTGHLPLETETTVFIFVNLLDFFVTYWLLAHASAGLGNFYESNPFAAFFLHRWGVVKGLLGFKLSIVVLVCVIAQVVALYRPETARKLLLFGTVVVFGVAVYGASLYVRHAGALPPPS